MSAPLPSTYTAVEIPVKSGEWSVVRRTFRPLELGEVLVRVLACGVCGGDHCIKDGLLPQCSYPRVPGHEVCGVVVEVGPGSKRWTVGDVVGRGWAGGHCFHCKLCRAGQFNFCKTLTITGMNADGGFAEYMIASWESLISVPAGMEPDQVGPLLCAGTTTFHSLRSLGLIPGSFVAVQGIGGLGHLAIQFARKMGFRVIVLSTSSDKEAIAKELGAQYFIDTSQQAVIPALAAITGDAGVACVIATVQSGKAMSSVIDALGVHGVLLTLGAGPEPITVWSGQLIHNNRLIQGWSSGTPNDGEECLEFAAAFDIKVMTEKFPLEKTAEAYDKMNTNKLRYRAVIMPELKA